ncbi:nucleoside hydrolase [Rathayibacter oskolensis]|uniref:nucleoside hydrolase n=1 Tax=Rathayibacter oskolensis TaxID=1891671 RepID=UPI00265F5BA0|nr:nucleoside hydrolase [Rathayibacter oskolensis]WKK70716.1 nucleoside hydrolase [Rathayibacter oskolensis]
MSAHRPRVVFDTDLGTDVDDALALALLLGASDAIDLLAVTTVYGDTLLRARLAQRYAGLAGRSLAVHAGETATHSGREVWWAGHEGSLHEGLERESVSAEPGVDALVRLVTAEPGTVDVIAVGPLTDIAAAIRRDDRFAGSVRRLWLMGGAFGTGVTEHNIRSDADAARTVLAAGIPTVIAGLEVTQRIAMRAEQLDAIRAAGALGEALHRDIRQWWEFWNETWNVPHDPVTVLALLRPELVVLSEPGTVTVGPGGDPEEDGLTTFTPDPSGSTRLVVDLDPEAVSAAIVAGVQAASRR